MGLHPLRHARGDWPPFDDRDLFILEKHEALIAKPRHQPCYKGNKIVFTNGLSTLSIRASSLIWLRLVQQNIVMSVSIALSSSRKAITLSLDFRQNRPPSSLCSAR